MTLVVERVHPSGSGTQKVYRYPNGYGASVIQTAFSYTDSVHEWELAVLRFTGDGDLDFELTYETPITDDVLGHLSAEEVQVTLKKIAKLSSRQE